MPKKRSPALHIGPLQHIIAEPITDPAEQAAIDKMRARELRKQARANARISRNGAKAKSSRRR
jgi:hypothetical protein